MCAMYPARAGSPTQMTINNQSMCGLTKLELTGTQRTTCQPSLHGHLDEAARARRSHRFQYLGRRRTDSRPARSGQDDHSQAATREVLLVLQVLVRGEEDVESSSLRSSNQSSILQRAPPQLKAVSTECPTSAWRSGAGVPWSMRTRTTRPPQRSGQRAQEQRGLAPERRRGTTARSPGWKRHLPGSRRGQRRARACHGRPRRRSHGWGRFPRLNSWTSRSWHSG